MRASTAFYPAVRSAQLRWWLPLLFCTLLAAQVGAVDHVHLGHADESSCEHCLQVADQFAPQPDVLSDLPAPAAVDDKIPAVAAAGGVVCNPAIRGPPNAS